MKGITSIKVWVVAGLFAALTSSASFAGDWAGKYRTEDTKGNAFAITLTGDGTAAGEKQGHVLNGTWTEEADAAVIKWDTGWTTKLSKDGDHRDLHRVDRRQRQMCIRDSSSMEEDSGSMDDAPVDPMEESEASE